MRYLSLIGLLIVVLALAGCNGANLFGAAQPNDLAQTADEIGPQSQVNNSGIMFYFPGKSPERVAVEGGMTNTGQAETNATASQQGSSEQAGSQTGGDPTSTNEGELEVPVTGGG